MNCARRFAREYHPKGSTSRHNELNIVHKEFWFLSQCAKYRERHAVPLFSWVFFMSTASMKTADLVSAVARISVELLQVKLPCRRVTLSSCSCFALAAATG